MTNKKLAELYEVPELKGKRTTGKDEIEYLYQKTGDEVFGKALELRQLDTLLNNFIPNWQPGIDGRVHTQWGFTAASGQLDSRNPNVLNISKHTKLGQAFRRCLVAPEGFGWVEADKKSFHVGTLGYIANDPEYIRFSQLNPHSIFTSYIMPRDWGESINFSWSDEDIMARCSEISKKSKAEKERTGIDLRQDVAKPCVLGNQLGLGPHKLYYKNRQSIQSIDHARELQAKIANLFPKVERCKEEIIEQAHKQTYLIDEWGKVQFFFEIYRWEKDRYGRWQRKRTDEAEKALAFRVQGVAFGMLKWEHLKMEKLGYNDRYNFVNTIHDSLVFLPSTRVLRDCIRDVGEVMNSPCSVLTNEATGPKGLVVKCEMSVGGNMADYKKDVNPYGMQEWKEAA